MNSMHAITGSRDPQVVEPELGRFDDSADRRAANRAVAVSAVGLALTGLFELAVALLSGSVGLLSDAFHNLSDVSTSLVVFLGFRISRRPATARYPYGLERAEDLAGLGVALVIWASAVFAGLESARKLFEHGSTSHVGVGIAAAAIGILGNQLVARYKLVVGRRIQSATLVGDAKHSWLDALSSAGAMVGLIGVAAGLSWADALAGFVVTAFIAHVGWEVTSDLVHHLLDGVEPTLLDQVEATAGAVNGVAHVHARARWTGRSLRLELETWHDDQLTLLEADAVCREVHRVVLSAIDEARVVTVRPRPVRISDHAELR
jgi:cation diffusion facilitator family transporter